MNPVLLQHFNQYFREKAIDPKASRFIVAISGGVDSVVLADLCKRSGFQFSLAHCNFRLRNEESERDEAFVRSFAQKLEVPLKVIHFDTSQFAQENKLSVQEAARALRYQWFDELKNTGGFDFILLAHHADDNIETVLMNFFRGTGLKGLTAIPGGSKEEKRLLRPLLGVRRKDIIEYAYKQGLTWVEDSSNSSVKYTRNYFRHELIPSVQKVFPQVEENLLDNIERFTKIHNLYQQMIAGLKDKICEKGVNEIRIPIKKLEKYLDTSLIYDIIKDYGFGEKQVPEVQKLLNAASGRFVENENFQVIRHRNWLIIAPKTSVTDIIAIDREQQLVRFPGGMLEFNLLSAGKLKLEGEANTALLDAKHIEYPLVLRKWKTGDYFYPLGMTKKKKLSRFFIDQKLSRNLKENMWILESGKRIIWVVGMRIDDRFKIIPSTREVVRVSLTNP
jgi:tRNA(Ile)-lysidine synthase